MSYNAILESVVKAVSTQPGRRDYPGLLQDAMGKVDTESFPVKA